MAKGDVNKTLYYKYATGTNSNGSTVYGTQRFSRVNVSATDDECYNTLNALSKLSHYATGTIELFLDRTEQLN